jgi:HAD superfamily hydrolase (TIGR01459 family)
MTKNIDGLGQISAGFDLFLLDQFGVLHDGNALYPGTIEALEHLKDQGKSVAIISNSGKRSAPNIERMVRIGIPRDLYDVLVTSGEVAWALLKQEHGAAANDPARRCLLITSGADTSPVDGLGAEVTEDSGQADFVLLAGGEGDRYDEAHYRRLLAPAATNGAPCICTNPDKISLGVTANISAPAASPRFMKSWAARCAGLASHSRQFMSTRSRSSRRRPVIARCVSATV